MFYFGEDFLSAGMPALYAVASLGFDLRFFHPVWIHPAWIERVADLFVGHCQPELQLLDLTL